MNQDKANLVLPRHRVRWLVQLAKRWYRDDAGVASVEYATIVALISAMSIAAVSALGSNVKVVLEQVSSSMERAPEQSPSPRVPRRP